MKLPIGHSGIYDTEKVFDKISQDTMTVMSSSYPLRKEEVKKPKKVSIKKMVTQEENNTDTSLCKTITAILGIACNFVAFGVAFAQSVDHFNCKTYDKIKDLIPAIVGTANKSLGDISEKALK